jgi:trimethylamine--corrinoid protein Co-methyltransferase
MGCSFESAVIDNDMIGCIQRALRGIEVTDETLSFEVIREVVLDGPGHFLTHDQTLNLMDTEYLRPEIADRSSIEDWEMAGSPDILQRAKARVREILSSHYPKYIDEDVDRRIRERFPIRLPEIAMRSGSERWARPT